MLDPVRVRITFDDLVRTYPSDSRLHMPRYDADMWLAHIGYFGLSIDGDFPRRSLILAGDACDCGVDDAVPIER